MSVNFLRKPQKVWPDYCLAIFQVSAILFILLFAVEYVVPGFVTSWFNPVYIFIIAVVSGVLAASQE